jgi:alpha-tubulin suppressor-like RCC1 family protein
MVNRYKRVLTVLAILLILGTGCTSAPAATSIRTSALNPGLTDTLPSTATGTSTSTPTFTQVNFPTLTETGTPSRTLAYEPKPSKVITTISVGGFTSCALTLGGGVRCWGDGTDGEVGDGKSGDIPNNGHYVTMPVDVIGLSSGVSVITVGGQHACALTSRGGVMCWGDNTWGELGDGTKDNSATPVDVSGLTGGVIAVVAGEANTCALTSVGGVECWGDNTYGQLGDATTDNNSSTPVEVSGLMSGISAISVGGETTCALTSGGGVKCWEANDSGQLGDGTITNTLPDGPYGKNIPVDVIGLASGISSIAVGGDHTCALASSGEVKCWGDNEVGQLGDGTKNSSTTPVDVRGLTSGVSTISAGEGSTCVLTLGGGVKCWGANDYGELGDGTNADRLTPVNVKGLTGVVSAIATNGDHTCAVILGGGIKCWGSNHGGSLGDGSLTQRNIPVNVDW